MPVKDQKHTEKYSMYNGDCIEVMADMPNECIDLFVYSPPFAELYNYSSSDRDLSNCKTYEEFLTHYEFVVEQTYRLLKPGRIAAIHCMDIKGPGKNSWRDFPGDIIRLHEKYGFRYFSKHIIWKDPFRVWLRTRLRCLQHNQLVKDSTECKAAGADYIVVMKKVGENKVPVNHDVGLSTYAGDNQPPPELVMKYANWKDPRTNELSHDIWRKYASSVWMDIRQNRMVPSEMAKEVKDEKHMCPLHLDVIERVLTLYSNKGENVMSPFAGVGSEVFGSVMVERKGIGVELKTSYYNQAIKNLEYEMNSEISNNESLFTLSAE